MEELRSSEILDKEIEAECRKKAEKILQNARENASKITDGLAQRLMNAKKDAEAKSAENLELYSKNINAALPLEKQRYQVSFIYNSIINELNTYFENLTDSSQLKILEKMMINAKSLITGLDGKKIDAEVVGYKTTDAKKILEAQFKNSEIKCVAGNENILTEEAVSGFKLRKGIVVKAENNSIVCRFTLDEKVKELLDKYCCELGLALFGGRLPE